MGGRGCRATVACMPQQLARWGAAAGCWKKVCRLVCVASNISEKQCRTLPYRQDNACGMLNVIYAVRAAPLFAWQAQPPAGLFCASMRTRAQLHQRLAPGSIHAPHGCRGLTWIGCRLRERQLITAAPAGVAACIPQCCHADRLRLIQVQLHPDCFHARRGAAELTAAVLRTCCPVLWPA